MFMVGLVTVPVKVTALEVAQVMACNVGLTLFVGAAVFCPMANVCVPAQPLGFTPVTVHVDTSKDVKLAVGPVCTDKPLVHV